MKFFVIKHTLNIRKVDDYKVPIILLKRVKCLQPRDIQLVNMPKSQLFRFTLLHKFMNKRFDVDDICKDDIL